MTNLAPVVFAMENTDSASAAVVRRIAYRAMENCGVDVGRLVREARADIVKERQARADRSVNSLQRLREWAARRDELAARIQGGPSVKVRALLEEGKSVDEIQVLLGVDRPYIAAVRDHAKARRAEQKLTEERKTLPRRHQSRVDRIRARLGWTSAPTKERKRQLPEGEIFIEAKQPGDAKTHRQPWPADVMRDMLSDQEYEAALLLYKAYHGMQSASKVGSLDGGGGGADPATKLALTPNQQTSGRTWAAIWPKLATGLRYTAQNLILGRPWAGEERALGFVDIGRKVGRVASPDHARGIGQGMLKATCAALAQISKDYDTTVKAEKRQVFRSFLQHPDVINCITEAANAATKELRAAHIRTAVGLLCKRTNFQAWVIEACVKKSVEEAEAARAKAA